MYNYQLEIEGQMSNVKSFKLMVRYPIGHKQAHHDKKRGFTLLELLLVIAIIASLAGIILMSLNPAQRLEEANETKYLANARDLKKAIEAYAIENGGNLPTSFNSLSYGYYDICKEGESTDCINIDELIPEYLPTLPEDSNNSTAEITGFRVRYDPSSTSIDVYAGDDYTQRIESGTTFTEGLAAYWKMDETSWNGTPNEVKDSSGAGNDGTAQNGVTTVLGKYGNGGSFDGTNDFLNLGNESALNLEYNKPFTISMWLRATNWTTPQALISKRNGSYIGYNFAYTSSMMRLDLANNTSNNEITVYWYTLPSTGVWTHLSLVYDGIDANGVNLYYDGLRQTKTIAANTLSSSISNTVNANIGRDSFSVGSAYFNGLIDDVRTYNRALNADEVTALYNYGAPPVAHWRFDDPTTGAGQVKVDSSGNGNNGMTGSIDSLGMDCTVQGKFEKGCMFDGSGDFIEIGDIEVLEPKNLTLAFWAKTNDYTRPQNGGLAKGDIFGTNTSISYRINFSSNIAVATIMMDSGSNESVNNIPIGDNNWHHWALSYDGAQVVFYKDSLIAGTNTATGNIDYDQTNNNFTIGARSNGNYSLDGLIDDVRIYNYARTQEQIHKDMNNQ